ncbi:hypothetical protein [Chitinivorax sp. B]|uniref:hypothetical protein n=1 Tax=Chitinivorax sp. B TaxID=2502235 RepID=UPI0010F44177|nr:hypothetical protein [Chitinivorax sp. B]
MSALEALDGVFYYLGEKFSGVVIASVDDFLSISKFSDGRVDLTESLELARQYDEKQLVDFDLLESFSPYDGDEIYSSEPFEYKGQLFNGIAFEFNGDICVAEKSIVDGLTVSEKAWGQAGDLIEFDGQDGGFWYQCSWYANKQVKYLKVSDRDGFELSVGLSRFGEVSSVAAEGDWRTKCREVSTELFPLDLNDLVQRRMAEKLSLSGRGVDDDLVVPLLSADCFQGMNSLLVNNVGLSDSVIVEICSHENVKEVYVRDSDCDRSELVTQIRLVNPRCSIVSSF